MFTPEITSPLKFFFAAATSPMVSSILFIPHFKHPSQRVRKPFSTTPNRAPCCHQSFACPFVGCSKPSASNEWLFLFNFHFHFDSQHNTSLQFTLVRPFARGFCFVSILIRHLHKPLTTDDGHDGSSKIGFFLSEALASCHRFIFILPSWSGFAFHSAVVNFPSLVFFSHVKPHFLISEDHWDIRIMSNTPQSLCLCSTFIV